MKIAIGIVCLSMAGLYVAIANKAPTNLGKICRWCTAGMYLAAAYIWLT